MKLQHRRKGKFGFSTVSVQHDGRVLKFETQENGVVEVDNEAQAQALEDTGEWKRLEDKEAPYALKDKTVDEVEEYLEDIEDLERLKELRSKESDGKNRKNAVSAIDSRIEEVKKQEEQVQDVEGEQVENEEVSEQGEEEDGAENEE